MPPSVSPARPAQSDREVWPLPVALAGGALVLIGGFALVVWGAGLPEFTQIDANRAILHYNAAIGIGVWGLGLLALARNRLLVARRLAGGLGLIGLVLLAAQIPGVNGLVNDWAFAPPPGRSVESTPDLALGMLLGAATLAVAARRPIDARRGLALTLLSAAQLVAGILSLLFAGTAGWPLFDGLTIVAGGAGFTLAVRRRLVPRLVLGPGLPAGVMLVGAVVTVVMWVGLNGEQTDRVERQAQFEAAHAVATAREGLNGRVTTLADLAGRDAHAGADKTREEAGSFIGSTPACLGVARVHADLKFEWVETRQNPPPSIRLAELGITDLVATGVRDGRLIVARPPRSYWNGVRMLVVFAPERPNTPGSGGLVSVFRLQELFAATVNQNVAPGYAIRVWDGNDMLFTRLTPDEKAPAQWRQTLAFPFRDATWTMEVWPTDEVLHRESLSLPRLALVFGALTTGLLALAVHLAQTARRRARALEAEGRQREAAQRALIQSEQKYRTLIDHLGQGVFLQDPDGRYIAANPEFCRTARRCEADILGRTDADLFDPGRAARYAEEVRTVLAEGKCVETEEDRDANNRRSVVRRVLSPVRDVAGGTIGVLGICWDVTEQRKLEAHVQQASKMDAIGQLAGGIAHDFNNLLTAILGNLELIQAVAPPGEQVRELADAASGAAARAASLTRRLLGFARRHQLDWVPADLNGIVEEVVVLLRRTIDPRVQIDTRLRPLGPVRGDPAQLNQVLMNLCLNARDAIDGAGRIAIETAEVAAADLPSGHGLDPREQTFVRLSVVDTGCGMTDEVRDRMFEPFFTTKDVGKGTGLGLAMVFATVRQHKGWIICRSEVRKGTRFDIYLPRTEAAQPKDAPPMHAGPDRVGRETILVADDEDAVRRLAAATLRRRGYAVLEATDGQQAVDTYRRDGERIDLVILDLTMPVMSGQEAFRHLLRLNPRVRVVFASGYAAEHLTDLENELMAGFVSKPYRPGELLTAIEVALRADSPAGAQLVECSR